jgi:hypothetical protein
MISKGGAARAGMATNSPPLGKGGRKTSSFAGSQAPSLALRAQKTMVRPRSGIAVLWVLFVLTLLSAIIGIILSQHYSGRHLLGQRQKRLQADWLARAGIELGIARLLDKGEPYKAGLTDLVPNSRVHIEVQAVPGSKTAYLLTSEAFYPTDEPHPVTRMQIREVQRVVEKGQARVESKREIH